LDVLEYSVVHVDGEWRLQVGHEIRGVFPNEEAATIAAMNAAYSARMIGYKARLADNRRKTLSGQRRSNADRRSGTERRAKGADPTERD
jgi:hypothetical protein